MPAPNYRKFVLDLATVRNRERIVDPGTKYGAVGFLAVPAGSGVEVAFGDNKDLLPVPGAGVSFNVSAMGANQCMGPADEGLFLSNPAGAGTLIFYVSFDGIILTGAA